MGDIDYDKVADSFQAVFEAIREEKASTDTVTAIEMNLQTAWAEINDDVDSIEDMERIYPDD